ncbi:3-oxoacyl-(acyl-carrier-protein) synthase 3 protein 1 [Sporotomaculum syntrophicum]|uniref:Beta-ketoacyl-[acyl-carrier-protein] synthase III n=1 Tax=Sporotomaculum syntrophicum TaxID=182264 RepID=A0A9D2WTP5_9FIRM|nr:beta-ketoacyl-ACP synthase III [Sporotomaculum syntrophicum]KAF1086736.1 3-oxoacyl-(acyl-carrier-protein) synthase 3 protein 1 [Sporotomaculum syntrophicum]
MAVETIRAGIVGIGTYAPERILTNFDLTKTLETSDEWIFSRSGIRERRIAADHEATSDLAVIACQRALEDAGVLPEEVDLIITATNTPDMLFPATACLVQDRLGATQAGAFDLLAGCTGFIYGGVVGAQFISAGTAKTVLVVGAETMSRVINWRDRNTCVLFGDGAGAVVMRQVPHDRGILSSMLGSDGSGGKFLDMPAGGSRLPSSSETIAQELNYLRMNGREVFKFAVRAMENGAVEVLRRAGLTNDDVDFLVPHQANIRIIEYAAKKMKLPMERVAVNVDRYGNTSTASVPLALEEAIKGGKIKDGDNVVLIGFGAGLTWAGLLIKWYDAKSRGRRE